MNTFKTGSPIGAISTANAILGVRPWLGRIVGPVEGALVEDGIASQYQIATPHGTLIAVGTANLFELSAEQLATLKKYEHAVFSDNKLLYGGFLRGFLPPL